MKEAWSIAMLISGALFVAGTVPISWERALAWRRADAARFRVEFAQTLRRVDQLQPLLLISCLASTVGFTVSASGTSRVLGMLGAACLLAVFIGSMAVLSPSSAGSST
ncbi:MAG TPA: hypothetical protein VED59_07420 [Acidimicrobiales bacterium]|nr:hypothetical protein [Acidimicrobiales bacterium]